MTLVLVTSVDTLFFRFKIYHFPFHENTNSVSSVFLNFFRFMKRTIELRECCCYLIVDSGIEGFK